MIESLLGRMFGGGGAPGWLAVELGETHVRVAHVRPDGERPAVEFAEERDWDAADPKSLERVAREFGARRFRCTTLLKPADYQILLVEAPAVKREELKPALRWRIKDMLDYHVDDATIDVLDLPVPPNTAQRAHYMYAVAARNETIRTTVERFQNAGLPLAVIDIPDIAQRNVAALYESEQRGVVAVTFDAHGMLLTVNFAGELYLSRRLDISGRQLLESSGEERVRLLDRVLVETQRSLDHCERTYSFFSMGRVVLGPLPDDVGLREHLASHLYLPVEPMDLDRTVTLPKDAAAWGAEERANWLKVIGAGLRIEEKAP
ncbi:MAG TPA: agglutinin biogenesis protein MshI [Burkholderiales bacterium]|nr:agglutinin biogenesis protein MshI [Burkholderiales bacterium]